MDDKVKQIYDLYVSKKLINPENVDFDTFSNASEEQLVSLYQLGAKNNLFNTTNQETFNSAFLKKKVDSGDSLDVDDGSSDVETGELESQETPKPFVIPETKEEIEALASEISGEYGEASPERQKEIDEQLKLLDEAELKIDQATPDPDPKEEESLFDTPEYTGDYEIGGVPISKEELLIQLQNPDFLEKAKNDPQFEVTTTDPEFQKELDIILGKIEEDSDYTPQTEEIEEEKIERLEKEEKERLEKEEKERLELEALKEKEEKMKAKIEEDRLHEEKMNVIRQEAADIGATIDDDMSYEEMEIAIKDRKQKIEEEKANTRKQNSAEIIDLKDTLKNWGLEYDPSISIEENKVRLQEKQEEKYPLKNKSTYELDYQENKIHQEIVKKYEDNESLHQATVDPEDIYNYLINNEKGTTLGGKTGHNFTDAQARAILNNIMGESGFEVGSIQKDPNTLEEYDIDGDSVGIGLFQHTFPSRKDGFRKYFEDRNLDWRDPANWKYQIDYMITEKETKDFLNAKGKKYKGKKDIIYGDDIDAITELFMLHWENPFDKSDKKIQQRQENKNIYRNIFRRGGIFRRYSGGGMVRKYPEGGYAPQTTQTQENIDPQTKQDDVQVPGSDQQTDEEYTPQSVAMQPWDYMNDVDAANYRKLLSENKLEEAKLILNKYPEAKDVKVIETVGNPNDGSPEGLEEKILNYDLIKNEILHNSSTSQNASPESLKQHAISMLNKVTWETYSSFSFHGDPSKVYGEDYMNNKEYIRKQELRQGAEEKNLKDGEQFIMVDKEVITKKDLIKIIEENPDIMDNLDYLNTPEGELPDYVRDNPEFAKLYSRRQDFPYLGEDLNSKIMSNSGLAPGVSWIDNEENLKKYQDALQRGWVYIGKNEKGLAQYLYTPSGAVLTQEEEYISIDGTKYAGYDPLLRNNGMDAELIEKFHSGHNAILEEWIEENPQYKVKTQEDITKEREAKEAQYEYKTFKNEEDIPLDYKWNHKSYNEDGSVNVRSYKGENDPPVEGQDDTFTGYGVSDTGSPLDLHDPEISAFQKTITNEEANKMAIGDYIVQKFIETLPKDKKGNINDIDYRRWKYLSDDPAVMALDSGIGLGNQTEHELRVQRDYYRTNLEQRAYEHFASSMNTALGSMDKVIEKTGIMKEAEELGEQILVSEDWLNKQFKMFENFPTKEDDDGKLVPDAESMTEQQIEDYNKLVDQLQSFNEDIYLPLKEREGDFNNMDIIKQYKGLIDNYNYASNWRSETMDRNEVYTNFKKDLDERQQAWDKASGWWAPLRWAESTERGLGNIFAQSSMYFKGFFTDDDVYDWTNQLADGWEFEKNHNSLLLTPSQLKLGDDYNYATVTADSKVSASTHNLKIKDSDFGKDFKIILSEDGITPIQVLDKNNVLVPMYSGLAQHVITKFQKDPTKYNLEIDENNGVWYDNVGQSGMDMFVDILISKRLGSLGKTNKAKRVIHAGSMMGLFNVRMYNDYRQTYLDEIGGSLSDADDYAKMQTMIVSLTQLINPNFNTGKGFATWFSPKKFTKAWKNLSLVSGRRALWSATKYNSKVLFTEGVTEGAQEVAELEVERITNKGYNYFTEGRNYDLTRDMKEYKNSFTIGATLGGIIGGGSQVRIKGFKSRLQQEALNYGYQNQDVFFNSLNDLVGTKNFYWEGETIELTQEKADEIRDKFKNLFQQADNIIATSDKDLKDGQKLHIINLLEHKQVLEAYQGHKNPKIQKQIKDQIADIDGKLSRLLKGESVSDVMAEPDEFGDLGVDSKNMSEASKNTVRHKNSGREWGTEEHKNTVRGLKLELNRLNKIKNRTKEENRLLSLHEELLNEVQQIKPTINEETDPILEEQIKETIRDESGRDAPGIESETEGAPKDSEVKSIRETDGTITKQVTPINEKSKIKDVLGKKVTYKGKEGIIQRDSDGNIVIKTPKGDFVVRTNKKGATPNQMLKTHGIKATGSTFTLDSKGKVSVNNNPKQDIVGMVKNEDGGLESMIVTDPDLTDKQIKTAKNKFKKEQKKLENGKITQSEFNNNVSNIKGVSLQM
mgnify:CR=1 FL=1